MVASIAFAVTVLIGSAASAHDFVPGKPQDHPVALIGGRIFTVSGAVIENGTVLFDKGKIVAVGANVAIPANAEKIEVNGRFVYPGIIASNATTGLSEIDAVRATRDGSEVGDINPDARADVAYNPESEVIPTIRSNGVTVANVVPDGGILSGTSSLMMLDGWTREDCALKRSAGVHLNWPRMSVYHAWWMKDSDEDQRKAIDRSMNRIDDAFRSAREYALAKKAGTAKARDLRWESMVPVLDGAEPLFVHCDDYRQIEAAVDFCAKQNVKMVLVGGQDSWRMLALLKSRDVPVILTRVHLLPRRDDEAYDLPYHLPAILDSAGIRFAIADGGAWQQRNVPFQAGTAVGFGLDRAHALRAITLSAAEILGAADRIGSLDVGKDATIVVSTGDILDPLTNRVSNEWIQGRAVDLRSKQTVLYEKYKEKAARMGR
jgi:imidazolonepropionase-like amidohydrolase